MSKNYVVIFGNLVSGILSIHGPFEDAQHADQWASVNGGNQTYIIMEVYLP